MSDSNLLAATFIAFANDPRTQVLVALSFADMIFGVLAALHPPRTFKWVRIADFFTTNILPNVGIYGLVFFLSALGFEALLGATTQYGSFAICASASVASIVRNFNISTGRQPKEEAILEQAVGTINLGNGPQLPIYTGEPATPPENHGLTQPPDS